MPCTTGRQDAGWRSFAASLRKSCARRLLTASPTSIRLIPKDSRSVQRMAEWSSRGEWSGAGENTGVSQCAPVAALPARVPPPDQVPDPLPCRWGRAYVGENCCGAALQAVRRGEDNPTCRHEEISGNEVVK